MIFKPRVPTPQQATFTLTSQDKRLWALLRLPLIETRSSFTLSLCCTKVPLNKTRDVCFHRTQSFVLHFKALISN